MCTIEMFKTQNMITMGMNEKSLSFKNGNESYGSQNFSDPIS